MTTKQICLTLEQEAFDKLKQLADINHRSLSNMASVIIAAIQSENIKEWIETIETKNSNLIESSRKKRS